VVNGKKKTVTEAILSFEEIVKLAFPNPPTGSNTALTVVYSKGTGKKREGILVAGETIVINEGMNFSVSATDKS